MNLHLPRRASRKRRGATSLTAAFATAGIAGAAAYWFLDPRRGAEHRRQAKETLRRTERELEERARHLGESAAEAARTARARVEAGTQDLSARARAASETATRRATEGAAALESRGVPPGRALTGAAGVLLLLRAASGGGLLRLPFAIAGASLLSRIAGGSEDLRRGVEATSQAARGAADKLREGGAGASRPGGAEGGGHGRQVEVRAVKSPGELEAGVASGRPEPTYGGRADRSGPHMGGGAGTTRGPGDYDASTSALIGEDAGDLGLGAPGTDDVSRDFESPEPGSGVREGDLGVVAPREAMGAEGEEAPRILAPDGSDARRGEESEDDARAREAGRGEGAAPTPRTDPPANDGG